MPKFTAALENWTSDSFKQILKKEIESLEAGILPLEAGITQGGHVNGHNITATILKTTDTPSSINTKVGIFFTEIVGGCNCNDDPVEINAYVEMVINIDKTTAEAGIVVLTN